MTTHNYEIVHDALEASEKARQRARKRLNRLTDALEKGQRPNVLVEVARARLDLAIDAITYPSNEGKRYWDD